MSPEIRSARGTPTTTSTTPSAKARNCSTVNGGSQGSTVRGTAPIGSGAPGASVGLGKSPVRSSGSVQVCPVFSPTPWRAVAPLPARPASLHVKTFRQAVQWGRQRHARCPREDAPTPAPRCPRLPLRSQCIRRPVPVPTIGGGSHASPARNRVRLRQKDTVWDHRSNLTAPQ
jgi:hypothetical protein